MGIRRIIAVVFAAAVAAPAVAGAQFTTFVQPPPRPADTAIIVGTDTIGRVIDAREVATAENLRAWVDSVAGDIAPPRDTVWRETTARGFVDGARAPDTATTLPVLLILGAGAIGIGIILLRTRA